MNTTLNTTQTTYFNKSFYDRKLLDSARTRLVHAKFGQKRSIPRHNGKRVEFRRYELFAPDVEAVTLQEGITPQGQSLSQSKVEAELSQYGAYVEVSDLLDMTAYDPVIADSAELLGEQLGTVLEWVTRDAMCATTNLQYAGEVDSREELDGQCLLTVEEIRKAVRTLKKNKARPFVNAVDGSPRKPHFICICSPDAAFDLQNDPLWQDVSKYSNAEQLYSGEIGRLFGVVFVEATEAKVYTQSVYNKVKSSTVNAAAFMLKNPPTEQEAAYLSVGGQEIYIGGSKYTLANSGSFDSSTNTVTLSAAASLTSEAAVYSMDASSAESGNSYKAEPVHATLLFGADSYGVIDVEGSGAVETIIKPQGSGGAGDPLNQRGTVGAKVAAYTAKVLNPLWLVKIEHCVSK